MRKDPVPISSSNRILREVAAPQRKLFLADCEAVDFSFSEVVARTAIPYGFVYFPLSGCISQLAGPPDRLLEVSLVGDEGMIGATTLLGVDAAPLDAMVQGAGTGLRMQSTRFVAHAGANPRFERLVRRYLYVQMAELALRSACTRYHLVDQRLARWLLMMGDRLHSDRFLLTHEFLAAMLGVRRAGVTEAATALSGRGLITYHRGEIALLDRAGLQRAACPCYDADMRSYRQLMQ